DGLPITGKGPGVIIMNGDPLNRCVATTLPRWVAAFATVLLVGACPSSPPNGPGCTVTGVAVNANPSSINTGTPTTATATLTASSACNGGVTWSATPAGGTLTPNGLTATFTAAAPGTYTLKATSTDDPTKSGTATVTVTQAAPPCGQANGTNTNHTTNTSADETWAGNGVTHVVPSSLTVSGSTTVTIEPCAIVALGPGASITVRDNARLISAGTSNTEFV